MRAQFLRFMKSLLNEVLSYSYAVAKAQSLEKLHSIVRQSVSREMSDAMEAFLACVVRTWGSGNPLRPASLGLDMVAYKFFTSTTDAFNFHYIPDKHRKLFSKIDEPHAVPEEEKLIKVYDGYLIVQISTPLRSSGQANRRSRLKYVPRRLGTWIEKASEGHNHCTAVFSGYVNVGLAVKQTRKLADLLEREMGACMKNLQ